MPKCFDNCQYPEQALGVHFCPDCKSSDVHVLCSEAAGITDNGNPHPYNYICIPCFNKSNKKPESTNPQSNDHMSAMVVIDKNEQQKQKRSKTVCDKGNLIKFIPQQFKKICNMGSLLYI